MSDTVVISCENACYTVFFGTLVGVSVFSVMWSELLMTSAISCPPENYVILVFKWLHYIFTCVAVV